jgi:hypothetical protein
MIWSGRVTLPALQTYVSENVFVPARVSGPTLYHEPVDALAYNFPVSGNGMWSDNCGHAEQSIAFYLPANMELVLLVNSPVNSSAPGQFLYSVVANAYTSNIVERIVFQ